jgi:hypothetical protein
MIYYATVYHKETGQIMQCSEFSCPEDQVEANYAARAMAFGESTHGVVRQRSDFDKHYVITLGGAEVIADRPPVPYQIDRTTVTAGTGDYITITGLHDPCELVIDDPDPTTETTVITVEGGGFEFEADVAGVYTVEIRRFPFLPAKIEITAT